MDDDPLLSQSVDLPEDQTGTAPIETPHYAPKPSKKKWLVFGTVLVIVAAAGLGYWLLSRPKSTTNSTDQSAKSNTPAPAPAPASDVPDATQTTVYENGPLGVTLTHPVGWKVTPTENKGVRVESPEFSLETVDGEEVTALFRIYIRKGARSQDSTYIGRGVALKDSEKITYTKPALGQRSDTLLSTFGLDEPTAFNYFFVAGNFQLKKGDTLGPDYGKEPETFIIAGGYSSDELTDDLAFYSVDADLPTTSEAYSQAFDIIKSLELH
ncbi:MAG: hypothetical protein KIH63_003970 [Candidatus Saccharibacteria bacterium]|nr:hypothetical protein [Candidatus Saccharibacteria bacterium]